MKRVWGLIKILFWSTIWFIGQLLFFLNYLIWRVPGRIRNLAYRKIVFISCQFARTHELRLAKERFWKISSETERLQEQYGITWFKQERRGESHG